MTKGSVPAMHRCAACGVKVDPDEGDAMHVCVISDGKRVPATAGEAAAARVAKEPKA